VGALLDGVAAYGLVFVTTELVLTGLPAVASAAGSVFWLRFWFEWDSFKARANRRKHGVPFERAALAFRDPLSITVPDAADPERWTTIGEVDGELIVGVHTEAEEIAGEEELRIRIISARRASRREARDYRG